MSSAWPIKYIIPSPSARITTSSAILDQIGEAAFSAPEIGDAEPQEQGHDAEAEEEPGCVEPALAPQHAPSKAVDDADHRVEAVPEAPGFGHDGARKSDRRDVEPELDDERNDVAEIAVFDVERGDQESRTEARQHRQRYKGGQERDVPTRREAVP